MNNPEAFSTLKKSKKFKLAVIAVIIGILLIFLSNLGTSGDRAANKSIPDGYSDLEKYSKDLESKISSLCADVAGVGSVEVAVSFSSGFEYVYASNSQTKTGNSSSSLSSEYIVIGSGSSEQLVYITEKPPTLSGIGIVCSGGNDPIIQYKLTSLLSAAYDLGANKIYITGK